MKRRPTRAAFTLLELAVALSFSGLLASVIYALASETLTNFARNISINKSYSDARLGMERLAVSLQSAGHTPVLVDASGAVTASSPAAGIRYYRYNDAPAYTIVGTLALTQTSIQVQIASGQYVPQPDDLIVMDTLGLQAPITGVSTSGSNATLSFSGTISANCVTPPTGTIMTGSKKALIFTQVSCIATGNQLRYYPRARDVATDGATVFNNPANYRVLANLVPGSTVPQQVKPFQIKASGLIQADIGALAPDYSQRGLGSTAFTTMTVSLGTRCPTSMVRAPY